MSEKRKTIQMTITRNINQTGKRLIRLLTLLFIVAGIFSGTRPAQAISPDIVISQVYGGGGNSGATYTNDFIELFNRGTAPVDVAGWSVQYASSTGTTWQVTALSGTIQPGQYYLVQEAAGTGGTTPLPTADAVGSIAMSGSSGKTLVANTATAFSGAAPSDASIIDVVGYGSANFFEGGGAAPTLSNTTADSRVANGCTDTDDNAADFAAGAPNPRNTTSPLNICGGAVDNAPAVASTNPANGDTNVAVDANIAVTFNEDVNVAGDWAEVSCAVSGVHTTAVSGGPQNYTLNPDTDFNNNESCTLTIFAAQVTDADTDDPPDNMAADFVSSFTVENTTPLTGTDLILTGIVDGPLTGGIPKAIEFYVINDITDLSIYGFGSANNGGGTDGQEFTFPAVSAAAGSFIYLASEETGFTTFFGFAPDYTSSAAEVNGDDAVELFQSGVVVDVFGDINVDGSGQPWDYLDGWVYRVNETGPDGSTFALANWTFSGINALDGETSNTTAVTPFPIGSYIPPASIGQPLPLSEEFDDCTLAGWEIISVDADTANTWACSATYSNIEANGYNNATPANEWLITPALNMNAQDNDRLTFRSQTSYTDSGLPYPQLEVLYSTDYNGDPSAATWTALTGITFSPENSGTWTDSGEIDLSGISSNNAYFAFHYTASSTSSATRWRLDAINFYERTGPFPYKIHEIQGNGLTSPVVGEQVLIEGVVVGDFQELGELGGFHVQEEDADADADPATSEGIYVYNYSHAVAIGDVVEVIGTVAEYNGLTEISSVSSVTILSSGASVTPTAVSMPVASLDDLEAYEGMLVTFPQDLYISEYFNFDRYNEIVLTAERLYQPTATFDPGSPEAAALTQANLLSRITLDDGRTGQNVDPARHPNGAEFTTTNTFRGGDILQNVTGVVDYANGLYKIQPTQGAVYVPQNLRTEMPDEVGGAIKVASFNVLNYFSTLDDGVNDICGPAEDQECRGADTPEEFQRQRDKIFAALAAINADVVGLIEIENHVTDAAVQDLVTGLNEYLGSETYAYVATGPIGTDAIKQAFIYKLASVNPVGAYALLDSTVDARFLDDYNRPALAQTFYDRYTGGHFTVVVNHLKSKGSDCNAIGDPDLGDGAGNCNVTRTLAAQALVDWLATDPTNSGDPDYLIIGDLNSYDKEDPIDAILAGADDVLGNSDDYTDLLYSFIGEDAYSYVFDSQLGYLDHGLANSTLLSQVTGATVWHINADEPDIIDYDMNFKQDAQDALWEPTAYRSSDHDPVVIGLQLEPEGPIVNDNGCYVLGIEGTPYPYAVNLVTTEHRSLKYFNRLSTYLFMAEIWGRTERLPRNTCYEIHGTDTHDIIFGGRADDVIFGYGSRDVLFGKNGDDTFTGGLGRDQFLGDGGYDTVLDREAGERCSSIEEGCPVHGHKDDHRKDH